MLYARLVLLLVAGACSGCSVLRTSSLTESAPMVLPGHTGRNQLSGQLGYGGKRGFDGSASYSLTNHLAISGNVFVNPQSFPDNPFPGWTTTYTTSIRSQYVEGQAFWYWVNRHSATWALAGGYGSGFRNLHWLDNQLDSRFSRYSVQASYSWRFPNGKRVGLGVKLHHTDYTDARLQEPTTAYSPTPAKTLIGGATDIVGVDLTQVVQFPLTPVLSFSGQAGCYFSSGSVRLGSLGSSSNGYSNVGVIATVGLALSLPARK